MTERPQWPRNGRTGKPQTPILRGKSELQHPTAAVDFGRAYLAILLHAAQDRAPISNGCVPPG